MDLAGLFRPMVYRDPDLGNLVRRRGVWRGQLALPHHGPAPLQVVGGWSRPPETRLHLARGLGSRYDELRPAIARALFAHYEPYAESVATWIGEFADAAKSEKSKG